MNRDQRAMLLTLVTFGIVLAVLVLVWGGRQDREVRRHPPRSVVVATTFPVPTTGETYPAPTGCPLKLELVQGCTP